MKPREKCLELYSQGLSLRAVATRMSIAPSTVLSAINHAGIESRPFPYARRSGKGYPKPGSPTYLEFAMKQWLWDAGYKCCAICRLWKSGVARNKLCKNCARITQNERYAKRRNKRQIDCKVTVSDELSAKAEAFYASRIDPHYYTGLRLQNRSPLQQFFS